MIVNIQVLRAVAAILVVLFHLSKYFETSETASQYLYLFFNQFGYAGVDIFFVISGYVMWVSSKGYQINNSKGQFLYNRACRIYLGYWPFFLISLFIFSMYGKQSLEQTDYVGSFFLYQTDLRHLLVPISWTLVFELYFYLFFFVCLNFSRESLPKLFLLAFSLIVVLQTGAVAIIDFYNPNNSPDSKLFLYFFTSPLCLEFLAGCLVGVFFEETRIKYLLPVVLFGLLMFGAGIAYQSIFIMPERSMAQGYFYPERVLFWGTTAVVIVATVIELEKRGVSLAGRWGQLLGSASYSIYLSHMVIFFLLRQLGVLHPPTTAWFSPEAGALFAFVVVLLYSVAHYLYVEKPLIAWGKSFWNYLAGQTARQ